MLRTKEAHAPSSLWREWRWWAGPAVLSLVLALLYLDPFVGDWDALDYSILALRGQPSSMALGRTLFIFTLHALWRAGSAVFQLQREDAYLLFKGVVVLMSALAIVSCWALARGVTGSRRAATVAALLVALSPAYVIYSGQVMTEVPSILLLTIALLVYLRGSQSRKTWMMLAGAALLGADVNVRETVAFYAPWLVIAPFACGWKPRWREIGVIICASLVFILFALGPFVMWFVTDTGGFQASWYGWRASLAEESARHPVELRNAIPFFTYFFITAPLVLVALPFALWREWRERGFSPLLALAATGLFSNLLLFFNYSTTINWRYFLTGLPALAPLAASFLLRASAARLKTERRSFVAVLLSMLLVAPVTGLLLHSLRKGFVEKHALIRDYRARLLQLPVDAVVIAGGQTVAVNYWRGVGTGRWDTIGTGSGWPGERLVPLIESYLKDGRRVFVDADPRLWAACGWQREETRELVKIEERFRFQRVSETVFEIRPRTDETALDAPHLERLLPENRPAEVKECAALDKLT